MTQRSIHWNGASLGDADTEVVNATDGIGYRLGNAEYESPFVDLGLRMVLNGDENRGVLRGWRNALAVTGVATPVSVDTGGAIVYGMPYENTAAVNVAVATPTYDTRQDRIVLRRNWAAQTIRITLITGVEGGGVPDMTQSPAPNGTGIYDVPLANLSTTTGGGITVTDAREYCQFGTAIRANAFSATHLTDASIAWADRETRTRRVFLGGGDLKPALAAGRFNTSYSVDYLMAITPPWDGAANEQAWQHTGVGYQGVQGVFRVPADYASGDITSKVWWVNNVAVAASFYVMTAVQHRSEYWRYGMPSFLTQAAITDTGAVSNVYTTTGATMTEAEVGLNGGAGGILNYLAFIYNAAGTEDIGIMGIEFDYTGYV